MRGAAGRGAEQHQVSLKPRLLSNSSESLRLAACDGDGIGLPPGFLVAGDLQTGRLRPVLPAWSHGDLRIFVLHPHRCVQTGRLRAFIDILTERFGTDPDREGFLPLA
jgi:DNA-binding transcriptional LysR family regulator